MRLQSAQSTTGIITEGAYKYKLVAISNQSCPLYLVSLMSNVEFQVFVVVKLLLHLIELSLKHYTSTTPFFATANRNSEKLISLLI